MKLEFVKRLLLNLLKYFGLITFGIIFGLVSLEIGLRLVPEETLNLLIAHRPIRFQLYQTDLQIGWRLKPNATTRHALMGEYDVQVQANSQGLNDFEHTYQKPSNTYRILVLGDSFTEGVQVPIADGFPHLLGECLNKHYQHSIEVINGGMSYYATVEELFFLQHEGVRYEPDLILVAFYIGNDITAYAARESEDNWFDAMGGYLIELDETGELKQTWIDWKHPSPYDNVSATQLFLRRNSKIYYVFEHSNSEINRWISKQTEELENTTFGQWLMPQTQKPEGVSKPSFKDDLKLMIYAPDFPYGHDTPPKLVEAWAIIDKIFSQIQEVSASINADLGVLIIPTQAQAHGFYYYEAYKKYNSIYGLDAASIDWNYAAPNQALAQLLDERNISNLDLLPHFRAYDTTHESFLYFEADKHFNQNGHQLTADLTCQWVIENKFIPGP
jgi:lysophospholipase L1-like esterase